MKRGEAWSQGILLVMLGIVLLVLGVMQALILPVRGVTNWSLAIVGLGIVLGGALVAHRAAPTRDLSVPANEKRLPSARVHRSSARR